MATVWGAEKEESMAYLGGAVALMRDRTVKEVCVAGIRVRGDLITQEKDGGGGS